MEEKEGIEALFLHATEGILVVNKKGEIIRINPSAEKLFGYEKGELLGKRIETLMPQRLTHKHEAHRNKYNEHPHPRAMGEGIDLLGLKKGGTEFPVEISLSPYSANGQKYVIAFIIDVTRRKLAEKQLSDSEKRFRTALNNMMEGVQIIDFDYRYKYVNDELVKQSKYTREELLNYTMMEKYPGIETSEVFKTIRHCMKDRVSCEMETQFVFPDSSSGWFALGIHPVPEGIFILSIDITEKKQAEEKLKNYSIELKQQVKNRTLILEEAIDELESTKKELNKALKQEKQLNELKSRFVSMASHEFRTPLATIQSSLSLVKKYGEMQDVGRQDKHISKIKSSISNLTDILNDFLSISKLEEGRVENISEEIDLKEFVSEIISEMQSITKNGQKIIFNHSGNGMVLLDKKLLKNILFNLTSNAIKFSSEGKNIEITSEAKNSSVKITVKDSGIGISKADQKHLFERFFRGHNATHIQGTGLGLNIVAKYVELMNGSISVTSEENKGTTFIITLPQ